MQEIFKHKLQHKAGIRNKTTYIQGSSRNHTSIKTKTKNKTNIQETEKGVETEINGTSTTYKYYRAKKNEILPYSRIKISIYEKSGFNDKVT